WGGGPQPARSPGCSGWGSYDPAYSSGSLRNSQIPRRWRGPIRGRRRGNRRGPVDVDGGGNNDRAVRDASESLIDCSTIVAVFFPEICKPAGQRAAPQEICSSPMVTEASPGGWRGPNERPALPTRDHRSRPSQSPDGPRTPPQVPPGPRPRCRPAGPTPVR